MELQYIVMTLIKIIISMPALVWILPQVESAALMGGHLDNLDAAKNNFSSPNYEYEFDFGDSQELGSNYTYVDETEEKPENLTTINKQPPMKEEVLEKSEEIPEASPLVVPGYNLPENIFNHGKPFYLEKDPLTGAINFNTKSLHNSDEYDYIEDEPSKDIFHKSNIDRKDGSLYSHKPNDVNQLTPNFHDFLNLPVKYNPDKHVYPLISSSYANTKVQGNVNKLHNHKDYSVTTYKPTISPTYFSTSRYQSYRTTTRPTEATTTTRVTTTTTPSTTTVKIPNLLYSGMNHPSFQLFEQTPQKVNTNDIYLTTKKAEISTTLSSTTAVPPTTTKRTMSLFEQLFGSDYDEEIEPTEKPKPPPLFNNLPSNKNKTPTTSTQDFRYTTPGFADNILTGSKMDHEYQYEDYENEFTATDNIAVETKTHKYEPKPTMFEAKPTVEQTTTTTMRSVETTTAQIIYGQAEKITTTQKPTTLQKIITTTPKLTTTSEKVTSLPLGENHFSISEPIIVATQNLREKLSGEIVPMQFSVPGENKAVLENSFDNKQIIQNAPSTSNIRIAHDQDTVSFVVGHHQSVDGGQGQSQGQGQHIGSNFKVSPYDQNPFRPLYEPPQNYGNQIQFQNQNQIQTSDSNKIIFENESPQHGGSEAMVSYTIGGGGGSVGNIQPVRNNEASLTIGVPISGEGFKPPVRNNEASLTIGVPVNENAAQVGSSGNIQPIRNSEASLSIGVPVNGVKVAGQVVDEKLEINNENVGNNGNKVVFPENEKLPDFSDLKPPRAPLHNKDVLNLSSKPMFHQLPSDLTPPHEKVVVPPSRRDRPRPPWDPRPGHFYSGRPEYARPPRPHGTANDIYKRIDNLPNILPQFRPNMKPGHHHHHHNHHHFNPAAEKQGYLRQPLLERPSSNKPIGFFEKLQPPPPPKNLQHIRKVPAELRQPIYDFDPQLRPPSHNLDVRANLPAVENVEQNLQPRPQFADDRVGTDLNLKDISDQFNLYKSPPKVIVANRRNGEDDPEIETLQMIQAKQIQQQEGKKENASSSFNANLNGKDSIEKPLYVVYPVNSPPLKLDAIDTSPKESVVIGTRAEAPLPPSKIKDSYEQTPLLSPKNRDDSPILKPHHRPLTYPSKSDFPYPIERPDKGHADNNNNKNDGFGDKFILNNQWNSVESDTEARIVTGSKIHASSNQISATLKTYTEKPIAVAYTPTESHHKEFTDKYSMPNYGSPVIPEIRPGVVENAEVSNHGSNEFTVSAIMHTHPQVAGDAAAQNLDFINRNKQNEIHRSDETYTTHVPQMAQQDFQAPFQASMNLENMSQGWTVVRDKNKPSEEPESTEVTTIPIATTSEFDIENFKPQLIGGFKPIYNMPEDIPKEEQLPERQE